MLNAGNPRYQRMYFDAGTDDDDIDNADCVVDNDNGCGDDDDYANIDDDYANIEDSRHRYWRLAEALDGQKSPSLVI